MNNQSNNLKLLKTGRYKNHYFIYNRKSTDEPNNQKNSIGYQKKENGRYAKNKQFQIAPLSIKGFCVDGIISERHSGFKEDDEVIFTKEGYVQYKIERPKFNQLMKFISKGYIKGVICLSWDRISRNKGDDTIIRKLMRKGADITFSHAHYDNTSAGALHMDIDGMFAEHHSRVTSEKVSIATRNLRERGICTYRAPIGYLNQGDMHHKPHDPKRGPIITKCFKLYAEGTWSLADLARYANEEGMTTRPMRRKRTMDELLAEEEDIKPIKKVSRPITANHMSRILSNPFYTGKILGPEKITHIKSNSHKALISQEIFDKVQEVLKKKKVSVRYEKQKKYPFRGKIRCGECQRVYTPYQKKGHIYFSSRCIKSCTNNLKSFSDKHLDAELNRITKGLLFTSDELTLFESSIQTDIALLENRRLEKIEHLQRRKKRDRESLAYLHTNKLTLLQTGAYSPEKFLEEELRLELNIENYILQEQESDLTIKEVMRDIVKISELLNRLMPTYNLMKLEEKEEFIKIIFSELFIKEKTLLYNVNSGFKPLKHRFDALGDPNAWISEHLKHKEDIALAIKNLSKWLHN